MYVMYWFFTINVEELLKIKTRIAKVREFIENQWNYDQTIQQARVKSTAEKLLNSMSST